MQCPVCLVENQPNAIRCDCGYEFVTSSDSKIISHLRSIEASVHTIKLLMVWWFVFSVIAALVTVLQWAMAH